MKARFLAGAAIAGAAASAILLASCSSDPGEGLPRDPAEDTGEAPEALAPPPASTGGPPLRWDGLLPGMVPFRSGPKQTANPICSNPVLSYFGGPLLQSPTVLAVFWSSAVNATEQANIGQFYADVMQSSYWSWLHEYDSAGLATGFNQTILPGTFGGNFVITPLKCAPGGANCKITDNDIQAELTRQINMGVLPPPSLDCTGNANTIYMVDFPPNISLTGPFGSGKSCVQFCAYHNTGTYGPNNIPLIYGANMDVFTGPCAAGCGGNPTRLEDSTDLHSHELTEAVTDPDIGLDTQANYAYPAGWGDNNNQCGEIADICADGSPGDHITVSGRTWAVQQLWSNKQHKCTSTGSVPPICSGTTVTNCRKCSCGDNGLGCSGGTPVCETSNSNVLFGACEQCTATNSTCGSATCQQSTTPAQDDICVGCTPQSSCPAGQNCGTAPDGCGGTINCGTCTPPQTCGGGGTPNVCGTSCVPTTMCPAGQNCGTASDGCGGTINCGTCTAPQTCGGGGAPNVCGCTPKTTCPSGQNCGTASDGCGGTITCGTCTPPQTCGGGGTPNVCGSGCVPTTMCPAGQNCGTAPDGCGGSITCGTCTPPSICGGGGTPNVCGTGCTPKTTCPVGQNCGTAPDGCGGLINCGTCMAPQTCGGGGAPNVCGCTPITTCPAGQNCGTASNGCGGTINCGTCLPPQTCGGGGTPNVCGGCIPKTACPAGFNCGTAPDGCGGTIACGACMPPATCGGTGQPNVCGCAPLTACPAGDNCGTVPNGCGGVVNCGTCASPLTCGGGGKPNVCGCAPKTLCPSGQNCGTASDGCGGTINCGSCAAPQTCGGSGIDNVCGCSPLTACPAGLNCGTMPDGCGGTIDCGTCMPPDFCGGTGVPNVCGCHPFDTCGNVECGTTPDGCGGQLFCGECTANQICSGGHCVDQTAATTTTTTSGSTTTSNAAGTGGSAPDTGAGGSGLYGRGGCYCASAPGDPTVPSGALLGLAGIVGLCARRRRAPAKQRAHR